MRATLDWSHGLLDDAERVLLRRLAAFVSGFTLEAAEAVCGLDGLQADDVLDSLAGLADESLVQVDANTASQATLPLSRDHSSLRSGQARG